MQELSKIYLLFRRNDAVYEELPGMVDSEPIAGVMVSALFSGLSSVVIRLE